MPAVIRSFNAKTGRATYETLNMELTVEEQAAQNAMRLAAHKLRRKVIIRTEFAKVENTNVDALGTTWNGGYASAVKLDAARRMATEAGLTEVTFFDTSNIGHTLSLANALVVCLAVGAKYQALFAQKQALMVAVDNAASLEELPAITFEV